MARTTPARKLRELARGAGVPAGSLPVVAMMLKLVGVPVEGIGMIIGVDRFLDMCRTTINVTGDLAAAVVVSRYEKTEHAPARDECRTACANVIAHGQAVEPR